MTGLPDSVLGDEGVCENEELSHDCGEGDLGLFSACDHAIVEDLELWIASGGGEGGHVEGAPQIWAPALDVTGAGMFAAVAGNGSQACDHGGLLGRQGADFSQADDQGDRGRGPDARDRGQHGQPPDQDGIGRDEALDFRAEVSGRRLGGAPLALDFGGGLGSCCRAELVEKGGSGGDCGVTAAQQLLKASEKLAGRRGRPGLEAFAQYGQHSAVDAVGFGQSADGFGEETRAQRIDDGDGVSAGVETAMGRPVELSGRLHHHERRFVGLKTALQSLDPLRVVGERAS